VRRETLLSILEIVVCYAIYVFITVPIHEFLHMYVLKALGGDGYCRLTPFGAEVIFTKMPRMPWLVTLSGGVLTGLIFLALAYWDYIDGDWEEYIALHMTAWPQIFYGVFETVAITRLPLTAYIMWADIIMGAGIVFSLVFIIPAVKELGRALSS